VKKGRREAKIVRHLAHEAKICPKNRPSVRARRFFGRKSTVSSGRVFLIAF
jgi:hypothetical protein